MKSFPNPSSLLERLITGFRRFSRNERIRGFSRYGFLVFFSFCGVLSAQAQARYKTIGLEKVNEADTLRWCWADTWTQDGKRALQLAQLYTDLFTQRIQYQSNQVMQGMDAKEALDEQDAYWEGLRKTYQDLLKQDISEEEKADIRKLLAEIDKNKAESKRQVSQQVNNLAQEGRSGNAGVNPADFSDERLLTIKRNLRKYVLGRKIWGFDRVRDFRNGYAAVGYTSDDDFGDRWGFVNREGRLAIPCVWNDVFNFNNHRYYKTSVYDNPQDEDDRPWTSVRKGNLVGMIDTTGQVRVPVRFGFANRAQIVFRQTEKGELAPARDAKTGQWGLINRKGEWKVKPIYKNEEDVEL